MCDIFNFPQDQGAHMFFWKKKNWYIIPADSSCSKSTIEVLGQGIKYVQTQQDRPQNSIIDVVLKPWL